jgi:ribonucleoside-diphosphate reductase alpha chain
VAAKAPAVAEPIVLPAADVAGPVCMLKPGDAGFEDCEACQ